MSTNRRSFLKGAGVVAAAPALAGAMADDKKAAAKPAEEKKASDATAKPAEGAKPAKPARETIAYPRTYTGKHLATIAFPLGGVCAGSLSLGGRGQLRDWEIFNRPDKGVAPDYAFGAIRVAVAGAKPVARVLESRFTAPLEGDSGLGTRNAPGLARFENATFTGEFPFAKIAFQDAHVPVRVELTAFSPFIPHDADASGVPAAVLRYKVTNPNAKSAQVSIAWAVENPVRPRTGKTKHAEGKDERRAVVRDSNMLSGLYMDNPGMAAEHPANGSFAVGVVGAGGKLSRTRGWQKAKWWVGPMLYWEQFKTHGDVGEDRSDGAPVGAVCLTRDIAAGASAEFTFVLAWHFPHRTPAWCGWDSGEGREHDIIGNWYATRFTDAWAAADDLATNLATLEKQSREFATALKESTIPGAVLDAATANLTTLVSQTCFRTADGEFHGFEGVGDHWGCCHGNCTHVWNYETATQFLFPQFARSLRKAAYGHSMDERGCMYFRQHLPEGSARSGFAAADGQMGQIVKACFDWRLSGDTDWLRSIWPRVKRSMEFCWIPGGWDADRDGVMEGVQHNTYDIEFYGPNPLCGIYYLAALRACETMATALGEPIFASECLRLFESGKKWMDINLFNGEYYIQQIKPTTKDKIAHGLTSSMGADDPGRPDFQMGNGCLADQLIGQYLAQLAGLGDVVDAAHLRKTLESLWKYNHYDTLAEHDSVERAYALNDEQALVVCSYGSAKPPRIPFPYSTEAWSGQEYLAASLFLLYGMAQQGIETYASTRRRHDGERRNPYNEPECGHHYARAMSSWSGLAVIAALRYDGPTQNVRIDRRAGPQPFRAFWATGTGWGRYTLVQKAARTTMTLEVLHGALPMSAISVQATSAKTTLKRGKTVVECKTESTGTWRRVSWNDTMRLEPGEVLELSL